MDCTAHRCSGCRFPVEHLYAKRLERLSTYQGLSTSTTDIGTPLLTSRIHLASSTRVYATCIRTDMTDEALLVAVVWTYLGSFRNILQHRSHVTSTVPNPQTCFTQGHQ